jgi:uncharacterized protein YacL
VKTLRSFKTLFGLIFALILCGVALGSGFLLRDQLDSVAPDPVGFIGVFYDMLKRPTFFGWFTVALGTVGLLAGAVVGPKIALLIIAAGDAIAKMNTRDKIAVTAGTLLGVSASLPFYFIFRQWPFFGIPISILIGVACVYLGIRAGLSMKDEMRFIASSGVPLGPDGTEIALEHPKLLDTNVIIDGRITDIVKTGFLSGTIYVPGFVLDELQHIADSSDSLKRARGRRGLDILNQMQKDFHLVVRSFDHKAAHAPNEEVDSRLVNLAKAINGSIVTNDFNLNKVAALQGVTVLNVNELANALKPVVLPGEEMHVLIVKEGKEPNQGVGYLDDGTMIVVEDGRRHIGEASTVVVSSVLQTVAGKMIFARMRERGK